MNSEVQAFVKAYIEAVHKRFEEAIALNQTSVTEGDRAFFDGAFFCYQDTMKILRKELKAHGYDTTDLEPMEPVLPEAEKINYITPSSDQEIL